MQCLQCRHENASDAKFCNQCAAPFAPVCATCGHKNTTDAKFCNQCGAALKASTSALDSVQSTRREVESESRFQALLLAVTPLLQREGRVTYRTLKYIFGVDDRLLSDLREELLLRQVAIDERGQVLVWTGQPSLTPLPMVTLPNQAILAEPTVTPPSFTALEAEPHGPTGSAETISTEAFRDEPAVPPSLLRSAPEAERRQLTVMFCDLVGSTDLSGKLDPEDLREVVRAYQETAAEVIQRYEGYIAQYLGDGLLIYFGFPVAHEDDAQRAIYTGLEIPKAIADLNTRLLVNYGVELAVRIGIHTGPVVVGEIGGGGRHEDLALGETPNIAARLESLAQPNTVVMSHVTARLAPHHFKLEDLGAHELKGVTEPIGVLRILGPTTMRRDEDESPPDGGAFLVGRDEEVGLLLRRWEQSKEGVGQIGVQPSVGTG